MSAAKKALKEQKTVRQLIIEYFEKAIKGCNEVVEIINKRLLQPFQEVLNSKNLSEFHRKEDAYRAVHGFITNLLFQVKNNILLLEKDERFYPNLIPGEFEKLKKLIAEYDIIAKTRGNIYKKHMEKIHEKENALNKLA